MVWYRSTTLQRAAVEGDHAVEGVFGVAKQPALLVFWRVPEDPRGHHGSEREGDDGGEDDGDGQGNRKFAEEPADDVAHEEQGNKNGDQGDGQREDREADLLGALKGGIERIIARLQIAGDVFDHDDGVVHDEAGGDGQRHQGEVVEAVAQQDTSRRTCRRAKPGRLRWE